MPLARTGTHPGRRRGRSRSPPRQKANWRRLQRQASRRSAAPRRCMRKNVEVTRVNHPSALARGIWWRASAGRENVRAVRNAGRRRCALQESDTRDHSAGGRSSGRPCLARTLERGQPHGATASRKHMASRVPAGRSSGSGPVRMKHIQSRHSRLPAEIGSGWARGPGDGVASPIQRRDRVGFSPTSRCARGGGGRIARRNAAGKGVQLRLLVTGRCPSK